MANTWKWYATGIQQVMKGCLDLDSSGKKVALMTQCFRASCTACNYSCVCGKAITPNNCYAAKGKATTLSIVKNGCYIELRGTDPVCWKCLTTTAGAAVLFACHATSTSAKLIGYVVFGDATTPCAVSSTAGAFKLDMTDANAAYLRIKWNG
jgi:hypothetical protein